MDGSLSVRLGGRFAGCGLVTFLGLILGSPLLAPMERMTGRHVHRNYSVKGQLNIDVDDKSGLSMDAFYNIPARVLNQDINDLCYPNRQAAPPTTLLLINPQGIVLSGGQFSMGHEMFYID